MRKEDKNVVIANLGELLQKYPHFYLVDTEGLNAEQTTALRRLCFKQNISNIKKTQVGIYLHDSSGAAACTTFTNMCDLPDGKKEFVADIVVPCHQLSRGSYIVDFSLSQFDYSAVPFDYDYVHNALSFEVKYQDANHQIPFVGWQPRLGSSVAQNSTVEIH